MTSGDPAITAGGALDPAGPARARVPLGRRRLRRGPLHLSLIGIVLRRCSPAASKCGAGPAGAGT